MTQPKSELSKLFEKVFETYTQKIKDFYKPATHEDWFLETPLILSKVDGNTAQKILELIEPLQKVEQKERFYKCLLYPVILLRKYQEKDVEDRNYYQSFMIENSIAHNWNVHFPIVIKELKEIITERERERERAKWFSSSLSQMQTTL